NIQNGLLNKKEWDNAVYDRYGRLMSYTENYTSERGLTSIKNWNADQYDIYGRVLNYNEEVINYNGNRTERNWMNGCYDIFGDILSYKEIFTDIYGISNSKIWDNAVYDNFGQVISYNEEMIDGLSVKTNKIWEKGRYDKFSRLMEYQETITHGLGAQNKKEWTALNYNNEDKLVSYKEINTNGLRVENEFTKENISYNKLGDMISYYENGINERGIKYIKTWDHAVYDNEGRLLSYKENVLDEQESEISKTWNGAVYDKGERVLNYNEIISKNGLVTTKDWINGEYDLFGRLISYNENITDERGQKYLKTWNEGVYDIYNRVLGYKETTEEIVTNGENNFTEKIWGSKTQKGNNPQYDIYARLISYNEENTDAYGVKTIKEWNNAFYNSLGDVVSYKENITDERRVIQTREWQDAVYNAYGNVIHYKELNKDGLNNETQRIWDGLSYDKNSRITSFKEQTIDTFGNIKNILRDKIIYNSLGDMESYSEQGIDKRGTSYTKTWTHGTYDGKGRILSYKEIYKDEREIIQETLWNASLYDRTNRALAYKETKIKNGLKKEKFWHNAVYDKYGCILSYEEDSKDEKSNQSFKVWNSYAYDNYNRILGYTETVTDSDNNKTIKQWGNFDGTHDNAVYDNHGNLVSYSEINEDIYGAVNFVIWNNSRYNNLGDVISYEETIKNELDKETKKVWEQGLYDKYGRIIHYKEKNTDGLGIISTNIWHGLLYDNLDRLTKIKEEKIDAFGNSSNFLKSNITYNSFGEMLCYNETGSNTQNVSYTKNWSNAEYDKKGRLLKYNEIFTDDRNEPIEKTWEASMYDKDSRILSYKEETKKNGLITTKNWHNGIYDKYGRLISYIEDQINERGLTNKKEWNAVLYDMYDRILDYSEKNTDNENNTANRIWKQGKYDTYGNIFSYVEDYTDIYGVDSQKEWDNAEYDNFGQIISYNEIVTLDNSLQTKRNWDKASYDKYGRIMHYEETNTDYKNNDSSKIWDAYIYDTKDRIIKFSENNTDTFGNRTNFTRNEMQYNELGDILHYHEHGKNINDAEYIKDWDSISYDQKARVLGYRETTQDERNVIINKVWENGVYDTGQRILSYNETLTKQYEDTIIKTVKKWQDAQYDKYGHLLTYKETNTDNYGINRDKSWYDADYDIYGNLCSYKETISDQRNNTTQKTWENAEYDSYNRLLHYEEQNIDALGLTASKIWDAFVYDNKNRLESFKEQNTDAVGLVSEYTRNDINYTKYDEINSYKEQGSNQRGVKYTKTWDNGAYDDLSRILSYKEKNIDEKGSITERTWEQAQYNGERLSAFTESINKDGTETKTRRKDISYDKYGNILKYEDIHSNQYSGIITKTWESDDKSYDKFGRVLGYKELQLDSDGKETLRKWGNYTDSAKPLYDKYNRLVSSKEQWTNVFGEIYEKNWQSLGYNVYGDMLGYKEETILPTSAKQEKTRENTTYDKYGRMLTYDDVLVINSNEGDTYRETYSFLGAKYNAQDRLLTHESIHTDIHGRQSITKQLNCGYDKFGNLIGYTEEKTLDNELLTLVWSNIVYDKMGRHKEYLKEEYLSSIPDITKVTSGKDLEYALYGDKIKGKEIKTIITEKNTGALESNELVITTQYNYKTEHDKVSEITTQIQTKGADENDNFLDYSETIIKNNITNSSYTESKTTISDNLNYTVITDRKNIVHDESGRIVRYKDTVKNSSVSLEPTIVERTDTIYGIAGSVISYKENTETNKESTDSYIYDLLYNVQGQILSSKKESANPKDTIITERVNAVYDAKGSIISYNDKNKYVSSNIIENLVWEAKTFTTDGLVKSFTKDITKHESDILITEYKIERNDTIYNEFGREKSYIEQKICDNDITIDTQVNDVIYDSMGNIAEQRQIQTHLGFINDYFDIDDIDNIEILKGAVLLLAGAEYEWEILTAEEKKNIIHGKTIKLEKDGKIIEVTLSEGKSIIVKREYKLITETMRSNAEFDAKGLLAGYTEIINTKRADGFEITETKTKNNITYDEKYRITSYDELVISSASPDKETLINVSDIKYSDSGYIISQKEKRIIQGRQNGIITFKTSTETDKYNIVYNNKREAVSYIEETTDHTTNILTKNIADNITYDNKGNLTARHEYITESKNGILEKIREITVNDIRYNNLNWEISKKQTITDTVFNDTKQVIYTNTQIINTLNTQYNKNGQKIYSKQITANSKDAITQTYIWNKGEYNTLGQIVSYNEEIINTSEKLNHIIIRKHTDIKYDIFGRETDKTFKEYNTKEPDLEKIYTTNNISYDYNNRKYSYIERTEEKGLNGSEHDLINVTSRRMTQYDGKARVSAFEEETHSYSDTADNGNYSIITNTIRQNMNYNNNDAVINYIDITKSSVNSNIPVTLTWNAEYNNKGNISYIKEIKKHSSDFTITTEKLGFVYNNINQLVNYVQNKTEDYAWKKISSQETRQNQIYNEKGQLTAYENINIQDIENNLSTVTARKNITYNTIGRINGYKDTIHTASSDNSLDTTRIIERSITLYDNAGREKIFEEEKFDDIRNIKELIIKENIVYNQNNFVISYDQTINKTDDLGLDAAGYTKKENIEYNIWGIENKYKQINKSSVNPDLIEEINFSCDIDNTSRINRSEIITIKKNKTNQHDYYVENAHVKDNIIYDGKGNETSYKEIITSSGSKGLFTVIDKQNIEYNSNNQIISYAEVNTARNEQGYPIYELIIDTNRNNTQYDIKGRESSYFETIKRSNEPALTAIVKFDNALYSNDGKIKLFTKETKKTDHNNAVDYTIYEERKNTVYNENGQTLGYTDNIISSDKKDVLETVSLSNIKYNEYGFQKSFIKTNNTKSITDETKLNTNIETKRKFTEYSNNGQVTGYKEEIRHGKSTDLITIITKDNMEYNDLNQTISYHENTISKQDTGNTPLYYTAADIIRENIVYTKNGYTSSYKDIITSNTQAQKIVDWQAHTYNDYGKISFYTETIDQQGRAKNTRTWSNAVYNNNLMLKGFTETIENELAVTSAKTQENITYNNLGQITNYTENGVFEDSAQYLKTFSAEQNNGYDIHGRTSANNLVTEYLDSGIKIEEKRGSTIYNNFGLMINYKETKNETYPNILDKTSTIDWNAEYNTKAQIESYIEIKNTYIQAEELYEHTITEESDKTYNNLGQIISFNNLFSKEVKDVNNTLIYTTWSNSTQENISYNNYGFKTYYKETMESNRGKTITCWTGRGFDKYGRTQTYTEIINENGIKGEVKRTDIQYDEKGRLIYYKEQGYRSGKLVNRTWQCSSADYDILNRNLSFSETGTASEGIYEKNVTDIIYNLLNQQLSYKETGYNNTDLSYTKERAKITYDKYGNLYSYNEIIDTIREHRESYWEAVSGYTETGNLQGYNETTIIQRLDTGEYTKRDIEWKADFISSYYENGLLNYFKNITTETLVEKDSDGSFIIKKDENNNVLQKKVSVQERANAVYDEFGRLTSYYEIYKTDLRTGAETSTDKTITYRTNINYYTKIEEELDISSKYWFRSGYKDLIISSGAGEKPIERYVTDIKYNQNGLMIDSTKIDAGQDLLAGILRHYIDMVNLFDVHGNISTDNMSAFERITYELSALLNSAASMGSDLLTLILDKVENFKAENKKDLEIIGSEINDLEIELNYKIDEYNDQLELYNSAKTLYEQGLGSLITYIEDTAGFISYFSNNKEHFTDDMQELIMYLGLIGETDLQNNIQPLWAGIVNDITAYLEIEENQETADALLETIELQINEFENILYEIQDKQELLSENFNYEFEDEINSLIKSQGYEETLNTIIQEMLNTIGTEKENKKQDYLSFDTLEQGTLGYEIYNRILIGLESKVNEERVKYLNILNKEVSKAQDIYDRLYAEWINFKGVTTEIYSPTVCKRVIYWQDENGNMHTTKGEQNANYDNAAHIGYSGNSLYYIIRNKENEFYITANDENVTIEELIDMKKNGEHYYDIEGLAEYTFYDCIDELIDIYNAKNEAKGKLENIKTLYGWNDLYQSCINNNIEDRITGARYQEYKALMEAFLADPFSNKEFNNKKESLITAYNDISSIYDTLNSTAHASTENKLKTLSGILHSLKSDYQEDYNQVYDAFYKDMGIEELYLKVLDEYNNLHQDYSASCSEIRNIDTEIEELNIELDNSNRELMKLNNESAQIEEQLNEFRRGHFYTSTYGDWPFFNVTFRFILTSSGNEYEEPFTITYNDTSKIIVHHNSRYRAEGGDWSSWTYNVRDYTDNYSYLLLISDPNYMNADVLTDYSYEEKNALGDSFKNAVALYGLLLRKEKIESGELINPIASRIQEIQLELESKQNEKNEKLQYKEDLSQQIIDKKQEFDNIQSQYLPEKNKLEYSEHLLNTISDCSNTLNEKSHQAKESYLEHLLDNTDKFKKISRGLNKAEESAFFIMNDSLENLLNLECNKFKETLNKITSEEFKTYSSEQSFNEINDLKVNVENLINAVLKLKSEAKNIVSNEDIIIAENNAYTNLIKALQSYDEESMQDNPEYNSYLKRFLKDYGIEILDSLYNTLSSVLVEFDKKVTDIEKVKMSLDEYKDMLLDIESDKNNISDGLEQRKYEYDFLYAKIEQEGKEDSINTIYDNIKTNIEDSNIVKNIISDITNLFSSLNQKTIIQIKTGIQSAITGMSNMRDEFIKIVSSENLNLLGKNFNDTFNNLSGFLPDINQTITSNNNFDYNLSINKKSNVVFDEYNREISWTEEAVSSNENSKHIQTNVSVTYRDNTNKYDTYSARTTIKNSEGAETIQNLFKTDFTYNKMFEPQTYKEIIFEADELLITKNESINKLNWNELCSEEKQSLMNNILNDIVTVDKSVSINCFTNIQYDANHRMKDYDVTNHTYGESYVTFSEALSMMNNINQQENIINALDEEIKKYEYLIETAQESGDWNSAFLKIFNSAVTKDELAVLNIDINALWQELIINQYIYEQVQIEDIFYSLADSIDLQIGAFDNTIKARIYSALNESSDRIVEISDFAGLGLTSEDIYTIWENLINNGYIKTHTYLNPETSNLESISIDSKYDFYKDIIFNIIKDKTEIDYKDFDAVTNTYLQIDINELWDDLCDRGYIDISGNLKDTFINLANSSEFTLKDIFNTRKDYIYNMIKAKYDYMQSILVNNGTADSNNFEEIIKSSQEFLKEEYTKQGMAENRVEDTQNALVNAKEVLMKLEAVRVQAETDMESTRESWTQDVINFYQNTINDTIASYFEDTDNNDIPQKLETLYANAVKSLDWLDEFNNGYENTVSQAFQELALSVKDKLSIVNSQIQSITQIKRMTTKEMYQLCTDLNILSESISKLKGNENLQIDNRGSINYINQALEKKKIDYAREKIDCKAEYQESQSLIDEFYLQEKKRLVNDKNNKWNNYVSQRDMNSQEYSNYWDAYNKWYNYNGEIVYRGGRDKGENHKIYRNMFDSDYEYQKYFWYYEIRYNADTEKCTLFYWPSSGRYAIGPDWEHKDAFDAWDSKCEDLFKDDGTKTWAIDYNNLNEDIPWDKEYLFGLLNTIIDIAYIEDNKINEVKNAYNNKNELYNTWEQARDAAYTQWISSKNNYNNFVDLFNNWFRKSNTDTCYKAGNSNEDISTASKDSSELGLKEYLKDGTAAPPSISDIQAKMGYFYSDHTQEFTNIRNHYVLWNTAINNYNAVFDALNNIEDSGYTEELSDMCKTIIQNTGLDSDTETSTFYGLCNKTADLDNKLIETIDTVKGNNKKSIIGAEEIKNRCYDETVKASEDFKKVFNSAEKSEINIKNLLNTYNTIGSNLKSIQSLRTEYNQIYNDLNNEQYGIKVKYAESIMNSAYYIDNKEINFSISEALALVNNGTVSIHGELYTLTGCDNIKSLKESAQIKVSINKTNTTSRHNINYDNRGNIFSYDEINFIGEQVIINGIKKDWTGLTQAEKSAIFTQQVTATLDDAGSITITKNHENKYNSNNQLIYSSQDIIEISPQKTHTLNVKKSGMQYDSQGSLAHYRTTTIDQEKNKTFIEKTIGNGMQYYENKLVKESEIKYIEYYNSFTSDDIDYYKSYTIHNKNTAYNDLKQLINYTKTITQGSKVTIESTINNVRYNEKGWILYSLLEKVEADKNLYNITTDLDELKAQSKVYIEEYKSADYNEQGRSISYIKSTTDKDNIVTNIEFCNNIEYDEQGRMIKNDIDFIALGRPNNDLYYTSSHLFTHITEFTRTGLALTQTKTTRTRGKITTQTTLDDLKYDRYGRLTESSYKITEDWMQDNAVIDHRERNEFLKDIKYNNNGEVISKTKITESRNKRAVEKNMENNIYFSDGNLALEKLFIEEESITNSIAKKDFFVLQIPNINELWEDLLSNGYINNEGVIQEKFKSLQDSSELILNSSFENKQELIYEILNKAVDVYNVSIIENSFNENSYDEAGRILHQNKKTVSFNIDKFSGINSNNILEINPPFTESIYEDITTSYDIKGRPDETCIIKNTYKYHEIEPKTETVISVTPIYGFDTSNRQLNMTNIRFKGSTLALEREGNIIESGWNDLTQQEKDNIISGAYKEIQDDKTIAVSRMDNIEYKDAHMSDWIGKTYVYGTIITDLKDTLNLAFSRLSVDNALIVFDNIFEYAMFDCNGIWVKAVEIQENEKLDLIRYAKFGESGVDDQGSAIVTTFRDTEIENIKMKTLVDQKSCVIRANTVYDSLDRIKGYDEFIVHNEGIVFNGIFTPAEDVKNINELAQIWKDENKIRGKINVSKDFVNVLPNTLITAAAMKDMCYDSAGNAASWNSVTYELKANYKDILRTEANGSDTIEMAVNRAIDKTILEVVYDEQKRQTAIQEKTTILGDGGTTTNSFTFFGYSENGKADKLLKIFKKHDGNMDNGTWTAETVEVESFTKIGEKELYDTIKTSKYHDVELQDAVEILVQEKGLKEFMDYNNVFSENVINNKYTIFKEDTNLKLIEERTKFTYNPSQENINDIRIAGTSIIRKNMATGQTGYEETGFTYLGDEKKPSASFTAKYGNFIINDTNNDGKETVDDFIFGTAPDTGSKITEYSSFKYNPVNGELSESDLIRIEEFGVSVNKIISSEHTEFIHEAGFIKESIKDSYTGIHETQLEFNTAAGTYNPIKANLHTNEHMKYEYNKQGELIGTQAVHTDTNKCAAVIGSSYKYDELGRVVYSETKTVEDGNDFALLNDTIQNEYAQLIQTSDVYNVTNTIKDNITYYNSGPNAGKMKTYRETITSSNTSLVKTINSTDEIVYDTYGRMQKSTSLSKRYYMGSEQDALIDETKVTTETNAYDSLGRITGMKRIVEAENKIIEEEITQTYNNLNGKIAQSIRNAHEYDPNNTELYNKQYTVTTNYNSYITDEGIRSSQAVSQSIETIEYANDMPRLRIFEEKNIKYNSKGLLIEDRRYISKNGISGIRDDGTFIPDNSYDTGVTIKNTKYRAYNEMGYAESY
ncbi:hypothetical protein ACFL4O_00740, partial [bacterium]